MANVAVLFRITDADLARRFLAFVERSRATTPGTISKSSAGLYLMEQGLKVVEKEEGK